VEDGYCGWECELDMALFAPLPKYIMCGPLGVWNDVTPNEEFILPGCSRVYTVLFHTYTCIYVCFLNIVSSKTTLHSIVLHGYGWYPQHFQSSILLVILT